MEEATIFPHLYPIKVILDRVAVLLMISTAKASVATSQKAEFNVRKAKAQIIYCIWLYLVMIKLM